MRAGCVQRATGRFQGCSIPTPTQSLRNLPVTPPGHAPTQRGDAHAQPDFVQNSRLGRKAAPGKETQAAGRLEARDTTRVSKHPAGNRGLAPSLGPVLPGPQRTVKHRPHLAVPGPSTL